MIEILAQVTAPKTAKHKGFTAGIVLQDDIVVEAADAIKYMRRWTRERVRNYCALRNWDISVVHRLERTK